MTPPISYRSTIWACYVANFVGAIVINLTPILFIPLKMLYGLSYIQFGILLATNYITQVVADLVFSWPTDKFGYRPFVVLAPILTIAGYLVFALAPVISPLDPFTWFMIGTILFSATGGLLELLLSAIVNGIPGDQKAKMMSVLHSFYAWGQLLVVLLTTLAVWYFGAANWPWIIVAWSVLPICNIVQFLLCPLPPQVPEEKRQGARILLRRTNFYLIILTIVFAGMTEVSMAMWTSAYLERAMQFPKIIGDVAGMCVFAIMLGIGRLGYGLFGANWAIDKLMAAGSAAACLLYLIAALSGNAVVSLAACALCCIAVSLLWPGSVILAGRAFPLAGAWLYAMLAAGGDIGASIGPALLGVVADTAAALPALQGILDLTALTAEQFGLRCGMLLGAIFPLGTLLLVSYQLNSFSKDDITCGTDPGADGSADVNLGQATDTRI